ncbi:SLAIN motif-containing protein-like isoform X2 [Mobula hypostoma]|uniref:SLAIN motif-containing protein-like isoform X2 n=1 Tax=Mobula hypostoma TaxID=723540 RepID=UPI002FC2AD7E
MRPMVGSNAVEPDRVGDAGLPVLPGSSGAMVSALPDADKEVKKLQDLVRKLELQNEQLRIRSGRGAKAGIDIGQLPPPGRAAAPTGCVGDGLDVPLSPGDPLLNEYEALFAGDGTVTGCWLRSQDGADEQQQSVFLEEDVLDLDPDPSAVEEDSWLYVSPKKTATTDRDHKVQNPLKWCRQVLDHPSPETEAACRSLMCRLDQGYPSIHSALSSQSSIDSELSTSDDSISMGYKLQDLTDVQIMARLQEESLRQDYASSSASASRRSSSASLNSLRRGTYSDQEFDTYSLDDEDEYDYSLSQRSMHRYSPSPRNSPRSQSPVRGAAIPGRVRPSRRCLQGRVSELMNYTKNQEEMRRSMPNLAKTGIRCSDSGRSSRSFESNLQMPNSRISRLQQSPAGPPTGKLRFTGNGNQTSFSNRQPVKAIANSNSPLTTRHSVKPTGYPGSASTVRRIQSPTCSGTSTGIASTGRSSSSAPVPRSIPTRSRVTCTATTTVSKSKLLQPARRTLQLPKAHSTVTEEKWKEGCY